MLQLDPKTRMIDSGYPPGKLERCFKASEKLRPFLKENKEVDAYAYGSVTTYTTEKEMNLESLLLEVVKSLGQELTIDQKKCNHCLKPETEITPMHELIIGRLASLHVLYGENFLGQISPKILVFLGERESLIPVILQYNKVEGKCFGDIAEGIILQGTKILLIRGQKIEPSCP